MRFYEAVKITGLTLAIEIYKVACGKDFHHANLTFDDWLRVMEASAESPKPVPSEVIARVYLQPSAKTYNEWEIVLRETRYKGDAGEMEKKAEIMNRLFAAITSVNECKKFYATCKKEELGTFFWTNRFELAIAEKSIRLGPDDFNDWVWTNKHVGGDGENRTLCLKKIEETAKSFEDWFTVYDSCNYPQDLRDRAFKKLVDFVR